MSYEEIGLRSYETGVALKSRVFVSVTHHDADWTENWFPSSFKGVWYCLREYCDYTQHLEVVSIAQVPVEVLTLYDRHEVDAELH